MLPLDLLTAIAIVLFSAVVIVFRRNVIDFSIYIFGSFAIAAIFFGVFERAQGSISPADANWLVIFSFFIGTVYVLLRRRSVIASGALRKWLVPVFLISIVAVLIFARWQAASEIQNIFSGAGRLAFPEDNARWVNFSSNLVQGNELSLTEGTSGGVAALIVIASSFVGVYFSLISAGENTPAKIIQTILLSHNILIVIAPLAVTTILSSVWLGRVRSASRSWFFNRNLWATVGVLWSISMLTLGVASAAGVGHLTLEFIILMLAFWASFTVHYRERKRHLLLITIVGSSVVSAWLPLAYIAIVIAAAGLILAMRKPWNLAEPKWWLTLSLFLTNLVVTFWIALPHIKFISDSALPSSGAPVVLITAVGGTRSVGRFEFVLLVACLIALVSLFYTYGKRRPLSYFARIYPIFLLLGYASSILLLDFIVSMESWPHYGARKLSFAFVLVSLAVLLPLVTRLLLDRTVLARLLSLGIIAILTMMITSSGSYKNGRVQLSAGIWSAYDLARDEQQSGAQSWLKFANPSVQSSSLETYPIACIQPSKNEDIIWGLNAHLCTRFLIGMQGIEPRTWNLFSTIITGNAISDDWSSEIQYLNSYFGTRPVLVIDEDGYVQNVITLSELLQGVAQKNE